VSGTTEDGWYSNNNSNWPFINEKQVLYDPLLSYLHFKSNNVYNEDNIQKRFLTAEGIVSFENNLIYDYDSAQRDFLFYDDNANSMNDWGQNSEMDYINNNGGDWIYD